MAIEAKGGGALTDDVSEILKKLTLEEKAGLCSGSGFWNLKSIERLGMPGIMMTDGPHGLRKQTGEGDHVGLRDSVPATCFPTASATASSWDTELLTEMGRAIAKECLQEGVSVILGPGANIKRSPLCGRNFEYISEDPYMTGKMAAALIKGIQSQGIGASLKHYAMNNQETRRMTIDSVVDERTQREIYLTGFEIAVRESRPWTVMCSYNKVDGTYMSENNHMLNDVLRTEWGFDGVVVTDWGACNDRVSGLKAGQDLEMPSSNGKNDKKIIEAVIAGDLPMEILDRAASHIIRLALKGMQNNRPGFRYDAKAHNVLARKIAADSAVLLKNEGVLPLNKNSKLAVIGEFAKKPRYQGAGSSLINPHKVESFCEELDKTGIDYEYAGGYDLKSENPDEVLLGRARECAAGADTAVIIAGLPPAYESEGFDRKHMRMPKSHNRLIEEIASVNPNTVVVLFNGAPVEMPWAGSVRGILECYLGGQAGGGAVADLLFGDINPSGKLAETFPLRLEDTPSFRYFPGYTKTVEYREGIYTGYRYYDKAGKEVLFPFGHGLSYTEFEYSDLSVQRKGEYDFRISADIRNNGNRAGAEVVQLYVGNNESPIFKAVNELKSFKKIFLEPGERKTVVFEIGERAFSFYNINIPGWHVDEGVYKISIGASSRDIRLECKVELGDSMNSVVPDYRKAAPGYYSFAESGFEIEENQFRILYGRNLPEREPVPDEPFQQNSTLGETRKKLLGRIVFGIMKRQVSKMLGESGDSAESGLLMVEAMLSEMPVRAVGMMGGDMLPPNFTDGYITMLNGKFIKGISMMFRRQKPII
ncbi:MAG: glycoside hydrolase family 3 C-terminal domain-containing protein [Clostridia bacterium]|nr:glycoside hydrolase family 3 C-terminal domain-containing protein [Clostridia bacterium]